MTTLVADTSGLVSLGVAAGHSPDPLARCLDTYDVQVPETVLDDIAAHDDAHGRAAAAVLERTDGMTVQSVTLDPDFPLDDGENAAVTLANEREASLLLCDEFNSLGLVHASLAGTRLVTTPTLLAAFVRQGTLRSADALAVLDGISRERSWGSNSYVERARSLLDT